MLRHVMPVFLAMALVVIPAAAFATDHASASENQGRTGANDSNGTMPADTIAPKPIKKKLHRTATRKTSAQAVKKKAATTKKRHAPAAKTAAKRKAVPAPAASRARNTN